MQKNQWYAGFNALRAFRYAITRNNETGYPERNKLITRSNNPQLFISERARLRILPRSLSTPNRKVGTAWSFQKTKEPEIIPLARWKRSRGSGSANTISNILNDRRWPPFCHPSFPRLLRITTTARNPWSRLVPFHDAAEAEESFGNYFRREF